MCCIGSIKGVVQEVTIELVVVPAKGVGKVFEIVLASIGVEEEDALVLELTFIKTLNIFNFAILNTERKIV